MAPGAAVELRIDPSHSISEHFPIRIRSSAADKADKSAMGVLPIDQLNMGLLGKAKVGQSLAGARAKWLSRLPFAFADFGRINGGQAHHNLSCTSR